MHLVFFLIDVSKCYYTRTKYTAVYLLSLCFTLQVGLPLCQANILLHQTSLLLAIEIKLYKPQTSNYKYMLCGRYFVTDIRSSNFSSNTGIGSLFLMKLFSVNIFEYLTCQFNAFQVILGTFHKASSCVVNGLLKKINVDSLFLGFGGKVNHF